MPLALTEPCPLPRMRRLAARSAADGTWAVGPAIEPIWTQFSALAGSDRAIASARMARSAGFAQR